MGYRMRYLAIIALALVAAFAAAAPDLSRWSPVAAKMYDLLAGEDQTLNQLWVSTAGNTTNVTQATTSTVIKATAGEVVGFYVNSTSSGTIRFYNDATTACDTNPVTNTITPAVGWHAFPARFGTAICALTGGAGVDITIVYR